MMKAKPTLALPKRSLPCALADIAYPLAKPLLFACQAETAHNITIAALVRLPTARRALAIPALTTRLAGIEFANPVGLAAGFDKDARVAHALAHFGFGAVEVGTVTPRPQAGNDKPRMFRLCEDEAIINRLGFNNAGAEAVAARLARLRDKAQLAVPLGANIGANRDSADKIADYVTAFAHLASLADYITVNVSSPNTAGLRALQDAGALDALLDALQEQRAALASQSQTAPTPIFLKVAPDLQARDIAAIVRVASDRRVDALIVSNTTISRPTGLSSAHREEVGGLSGAPLRERAQQCLQSFYRASEGSIPLIAVGGIATIDDLWARIGSGASMVQIYTAMVYRGPGLAARLVCELAERLHREGFAHISEAIGHAAD